MLCYVFISTSQTPKIPDDIDELNERIKCQAASKTREHIDVVHPVKRATRAELFDATGQQANQGALENIYEQTCTSFSSK